MSNQPKKTDECTTMTAQCVALTDKGICLKNIKGVERWFARSKVEVISGETAKGNHLQVKIPNWLLKGQKSATVQPEIRFTAKVLITGVLVDQSAKAMQVRCDADMVERWLAFSKIEIEQDATVPGDPVRVIVPAWLTKHASGHFPSWVRGALL